MLTCSAGCRFFMFVRVGNRIPASQVAASSIRRVRHNSGPTAGALLLHLCKTSKERNSGDIIRFIMFVQHTETESIRNMQRYCQNIQREFWILLSFQGKCGQGDPLECHWLRSIDILGIRNQSQCSLALQVTQCQIQIHHDPPSFPSFVEESGVHGPRHGL